MQVKTLARTALGTIALCAVLLFNYWASYQPLSLLVYSGFVLALIGLANILLPFRFLGVRKRSSGTLVFAGGAALAVTGLLWPAQVIQASQRASHLDDIMPEYQFAERHTIRTRARPEEVMRAVRDSTWGDLRSLNTLMKIRGIVLRAPFQATGYFAPDKRVMDVFTASGYLADSSGHEFVMFGAVNSRLKRGVVIHTWEEYVDCRDPGTAKMAFNFTAEDAGGGWTTVTTETRMMVEDSSSHAPAIYWRLIVPGSGLLRREWLAGIKRRAESER